MVGGRRIPVVLPSRRDPRLRLSAVIFALQVLGQTVLGFKLSIAQILVSIGVCACIDAALAFRRDRVLAWPASGILTGSSVAFILRASGTRHTVLARVARNRHLVNAWFRWAYLHMNHHLRQFGA